VSEELAMLKVIMIGCDLHDKAMLLKVAVGREEPETRVVKNTAPGRKAMIAHLLERAKALGGARIVFVYEASGQGFGLHDELTQAGIECYMLAPTKIARSQRQRSQKTDDKDALGLLQLLRAHILAGNPLPTVWIPDLQTRDDRELVRMRLDVGVKITLLKAQVQSLLKRHQLRRPQEAGKGWTKRFWAWLRCALCEPVGPTPSPLGPGGKSALASLMRQLRFLEDEEVRLDQQLVGLACSPRYAAAIQEMAKLCGVGVLTALVFLTEIGDLGRFANRRQIAAYMGLVPATQESGEAHDRKGHITRQGSSRIRKVLCQATWSRVRYDPAEKAAYERIKAKNPKHKKIAVVASMRRLGVRMWHRGLAAGQAPLSNLPQTAQTYQQETGEAALQVRLRRRIFEGMTRVSEGKEKQPPAGELPQQRLDAPSAHPRLGYPLSGCVPAEPDSVSPSNGSIP
jgi:transposase